jgi:hypothetical protein
MRRHLAAVDFAAVDVEQGISDAWASVAAFVPRLAAFLVVLATGWLLARILLALVGRALRRLGLDAAAERGGLARALAGTKRPPSDLVARILYYAALLVTVQVAFGVFGPNPISLLLGDVVAWLPNAAVAIVIVVVAAALAAAARDLVNGAVGALPYGGPLAAAAGAAVWGLGIVAALTQVGVAAAVTLPVLVTVLATVGGILVVGVGGGMIRPMQARWERWLGAIERESDEVRRHSASYRRGREDALVRARHASGQPRAMAGPGQGSLLEAEERAGTASGR